MFERLGKFIITLIVLLFGGVFILLLGCGIIAAVLAIIKFIIGPIFIIGIVVGIILIIAAIIAYINF